LVKDGSPRIPRRPIGRSGLAVKDFSVATRTEPPKSSPQVASADAYFVMNQPSPDKRLQHARDLPLTRVTRSLVDPETRIAMSRHVAAALTAAIVATILLTGVAAGRASAPGQQPPTNLTPPTISGTAQVGSSLTAAVGTWSGKRLTFAYQWLRCDSSGASCIAISGATSATRTLSTTDLDTRLRVVVTATNRYGTAAATSAATAAVVSAPIAPAPPPPPPSPTITPPSSTSPPTISGTPQQGQTLNASTGSWSGTTPLTYTYQWQRCDSSGGSCTSVAGATATSYLLASADVGSTMRVSVTASNSVGSAAAASAATPVITVLSDSGSSSSAIVGGRWYSTSSAFNTPIPSSPPIHPDSALMRSTISSHLFGPTGSSVPSIYYATSSTPTVTVQLNYPTCNSAQYKVPIPAGAVVEKKNESKLAVAVSDTGVEWDLYKVTPPGITPLTSGGSPQCAANSNWAATVIARHDPGWSSSDGYGEWSARASHTYEGAGTIRPRDTQMPTGRTWDHALALAVPFTSSGNCHPSYVAPATGGDGTTGGCGAVPTGARLQLDPSIDCSSWTSITKEWMRQECRTLQTYGAIVVDTGGDAFVAQYPDSISPYTWPWAGSNVNLPTDLMSRFRVIDWTRWTG
jgi:hypothetical protein